MRRGCLPMRVTNRSSTNMPVRLPTEWDARTLLGDHPFDPSSLPQDDRAALEDLFELDASTEYDARYLHREIQSRHPALPAPVEAFLQRWGRDERNHYRGLRRLWSCVTGRSETALDRKMRKRQAGFDALDEILRDPFHFMVAFAYDERVTVQAYATDYALYDGLSSAAGQWVRRTNRDEAMHYRNAVHIVRTWYADRLDEVPDLIRALLGHDLQRGPYKSTFLLDHDDGALYFTDEKLTRCADIACRAILRGRGGSS